MVKSIEKVLTFFVVLVLILLLIQLLGPYIYDAIEPAGNQVAGIIEKLWNGIRSIAHTGSGHYH
ncbi:MAG TPA: hypothetical protein VFO16_15040 [Pseudonocardiaceae bacterium]|nr:hypothetical protein [Pseudonocardiaceae bacterium]